MIRIGSIVFRVADLERQMNFWTAALDHIARDALIDDFVVLRPRNGVGPDISLDQHHSSAPLPPRIHLDLSTDDQDHEVDRLLALGATHVHWDRRPDGADYVILADPDGNRFCVVDTR